MSPEEPVSPPAPVPPVTSADPAPSPRSPAEGAVLLLSVFVVASCGIAYELVIGATGAYIAGDGVTQFSLTIGVFLSAMGLGSFLSRQVKGNLLDTFIGIEIVVGVVGGFANTILFLVYGFLSGYEVVFYSLLVFVGTLIGLEIPLLLRLLAEYGPLRVNVANVLGFDYLGALVVSIAFPLVLLPLLGLMRSGLLFGLINVLVAIGNLIFFRRRQLSRALPVGALLGLGLLGFGFGFADRLLHLSEVEQYEDDIVLTRQTPYQRIVVTRWGSDLRLYLDRNIQFSSVDEYRYHEALVHPALATIPSRERILVLGGGDGLGVREILRYPDVKEIVLVDIDREMVELCRTNVHLRKVNQGALDSPKLKKIYRDAWAYVREARGHFNAIIVDFPDPANEKVAKLYSLAFYRQARHLLAADGVMAVQSTSPYFSPGAFWCIHRTLKEAGLTVVPIHAYVPTFGQWGFNLASLRPLPYDRAKLPSGLRYVGKAMYPGMFLWPDDEGPVEVDVSTLDNPRVVHYYDQGFRAFFRTRTGGTGRRGSRQ